MSTRLAQDFYAQDTIEVARRLLGQHLVHRLSDGRCLSGRIVETEAYLGVVDQAAHSFAGRRTPRTEVMFGPPGFSYIYFIYGMYFCFNVVTAPREVPEAVLVRALDLDEGVGRSHDQSSQQLHQVANGPGKLCRALQLDRSSNALDLVRNERVWIEAGADIAESDVIEGPRVGISYAEDAVHWPLRFAIRHHPALSPAKFPRE